MAKRDRLTLLVVLQIQIYFLSLGSIHISYGQRRTTTTVGTTSAYDPFWSTASTSRSRPNSNFVDNEGRSTPPSRTRTSSTIRPQIGPPTDPSFNGFDRFSSTTRRPWMVTPTSGWVIRESTTTRRPTVTPPSVNFTVADSQNSHLHPIWNASTHEATLNIKNFRELTFKFFCNGSYPIEWLSGREVGESWEVDELRHFQQIPGRNALSPSRLLFPVPPPSKFMATYTVILTLTFEKAENVPKNFTLTCAQVRRNFHESNSPKKQTDVKISMDTNMTMHLHVSKSKDVYDLASSNTRESYTRRQYSDPLGTNQNCMVELKWIPDSGLFECASKLASNLSIDYTDKNCYDYASCEKTYTNKTCETLWLRSSIVTKSSTDLWPVGSTPSSGIIHCKSNGETNTSTALQFFHSLPVICPGDNPFTRLQLYMAKSSFLHRVTLQEDFVSFCSTPKSYDESNKEEIAPLVVYAGENATVTCIASLYHFATGTRIKYMYNNQQIEQYAIIADATTVKNKNRGCFNFTAKVLIKSADVSGLICENYLKQSTYSVQKPIRVLVKTPKSVNFTGGITQLASWNYTGQPGFELHCEADGDPEPTITWRKEGRPIPERIKVVTVSLSESILKFPVIKDSSKLSEYHGTYTCEAANRLDMSTRSFQVQSTTSPGIPVVITNSENSDSSTGDSLWFLWVILPIFGVIVSAVIGFLVWKLKKQSHELRLLSNAEVDEFMFGKPEFLQHHSSSEEVNNYAPFLPYNKCYEVSKEQLEIEPNAVLGSGAYAIVLKGALVRKEGERVPVAIKTARTMDDISLFKALLSELKIMGFIGTHPNIVNLMGAHTKNIQNREIFIAIEFCQNGNLLAYLRDHRNQIKNLVTQNGDYDFIPGGLDLVSRESFIGPANGLNTVTLIKWAYEVATGMEFLSQKKVIHGDLAARNILLSEHLIAKIGDFGLSRQLFEYANYIKKQQSPLPWKWLAIECLQDMRFSVKSDVWAYAILLFEVFSLGQVPYPGHSYNDEFLEALVTGKRPNRPAHATNAIYTFMTTCWRDNPDERPNFTGVREFFNGILSPLIPQDYIDLHDMITTVVPSPSANSGTDIHKTLQTSPSTCFSTNTGSKSLGYEKKQGQGRFSFNLNHKTITAVFHRN